VCIFSRAYGKEMSALESMIASGGEAPINPALAYELPLPSTVVVDRQQHVRAYPSSASSLSSTGTKTVRIRIGGEGFVDPSSMRVQYTITNGASDKYLRPLTGPWALWQQAYCRSGGVELDNIPHYGRWHNQMGWLHLDRESQWGSAGIEGFHVSKVSAKNPFKPEVGQLAGNVSLTVLHRLHLSLLSSGKLLPVKYAPLEIELSMVNDLNDFLYPASTSSNTGTQSFTVSDVQILMDTYTLDESVLQSFYSALLKNKVLSVPIMNCYQICHPLPGNTTSYSFSSVRSFSRLAAVWLTFRKTGPRSTEFLCPGPLPGEDDGADLNLNAASVPTARLSIGPHNWPDPQPVSSVAEYYMMFTKALGGTQPNITRREFEHDAFTIAWNIQKSPQDPTTAISTRSGDLVRVQLDNMTADRATECWMTLISFGVCAIRESGITLLS
jgi:hypothetical protein